MQAEGTVPLMGHIVLMAKENLVFLRITQLPNGDRKHETINIDEWREYIALQPKETTND
jgi:hypothetical protein